MAVVQWCVLNKEPVIDAINGYLVEVSVEPSGYKKTLILYDEECAFCRNAAAYWKQVAKDQVNVFTAKTGGG